MLAGVGVCVPACEDPLRRVPVIVGARGALVGEVSAHVRGVPPHGNGGVWRCSVRGG